MKSPQKVKSLWSSLLTLRVIRYLNLKYQKNLTDAHLKKLAESPSASSIIRLNLSHTGITYDGIVALWRSQTFGSVRSDDPIYESCYNKPVSIIKIEIGHTPALTQYKNLKSRGKNIFPLPLRDEFEIVYLNLSDDNNHLVGFKKLILRDHKKAI